MPQESQRLQRLGIAGARATNRRPGRPRERGRKWGILDHRGTDGDTPTARWSPDIGLSLTGINSARRCCRKRRTARSASRPIACSVEEDPDLLESPHRPLRRGDALVDEAGRFRETIPDGAGKDDLLDTHRSPRRGLIHRSHRWPQISAHPQTKRLCSRRGPPKLSRRPVRHQHRFRSDHLSSSAPSVDPSLLAQPMVGRLRMTPT